MEREGGGGGEEGGGQPTDTPNNPNSRETVLPIHTREEKKKKRERKEGNKKEKGRKEGKITKEKESNHTKTKLKYFILQSPEDQHQSKPLYDPRCAQESLQDSEAREVIDPSDKET